MPQSIKSKLNKIVRKNIARKIHLVLNGDIFCGQKRPCSSNQLTEWLTKGQLRCQRCLKKYESQA